MPQDNQSDFIVESGAGASDQEPGEKRKLSRSRARRISCLSVLVLLFFLGSVILYLLPWRIICNLDVPFIPVRARFSFRLFPSDLERYQDLRYEEIFSSFPFYLIHDRRPKKTTAAAPWTAIPVRDDYLSGSHHKPSSSPEYLDSSDPPRKTLWVVPENTVKFEVPEGVTHIGAKAFWQCIHLKSVTLPSTLVSIGEGAFAGCTGLKRITIPDSVQMIGRHAFHGCTALSDIRLSANLAGLGREAFYNCTSLKTVSFPHTLRWFGHDVFAGCTALKSVRTFGPAPESFPAADDKLLSEHGLHFSETVFRVENNSTLQYASVPAGMQSVSFKGCIRLEEVVVARDATLQDFTGCLSLLRLRIHKHGRSGNPAPYITYSAFNSCNTGYTDGNCSFLREVELPDVVKIGVEAFSKCVSLSRITLPESLESIGKGAFRHCRSLEKITIPAGVKDIGAGAFEQDIHLTGAEFAGSPRLGANVFKDCVSLAKCEFKKELESIPDSMFANCKLLKVIRIPNGVKEIGNKAFYECASLRSVTIPDGVESIGENAFYGAQPLDHVEIPASVKRIGKDAFGRHYGAKDHKIVFHGDIEIIDRIGAAWEDMVFPPESRFRRLDDGTLINSVEGRLIEAPKDTAGVYTVPENIRTIGYMAFGGCTFDRIVVPATVTRFEDGAFSACRAREIVLPDNLERVVDRMFESCSTPVITIPPGVKEIGERAFCNCFNVKKVVLPDGLERIGKEAFRGCYIREIDIPASVKWISKDAFPYSGCNQYVQENYGHLMTPDPDAPEEEAEPSPQ